jgi:hypothetical protein
MTAPTVAITISEVPPERAQTKQVKQKSADNLAIPSGMSMTGPYPPVPIIFPTAQPAIRPDDYREHMIWQTSCGAHPSGGAVRQVWWLAACQATGTAAASGKNV